MPQSRSGSTIKTINITLAKDGDDFQVILDSGQQVTSNTTPVQSISVELPAEFLQLRFTTTDFQVGTDSYIVEASTEVGEQATPWASDCGEHTSPLVERNPTREGTDEIYTQLMTLSFLIKGPVVEGALPPLAGQIKPPTTVVIRSRLEWP